MLTKVTPLQLPFGSITTEHLSPNILSALGDQAHFIQRDMYDNSQDRILIGSHDSFISCLVEYVIRTSNNLQHGTMYILQNGVDLRCNHEYYCLTNMLNGVDLTGELFENNVNIVVTLENVGENIQFFYRVSSLITEGV